MMERKAVRSRDIAIIGYDKESAVLEIAVKNGGVYHYSKVPEELYRGFMGASSYGAYFNQRIKEQYPYQKIA